MPDPAVNPVIESLELYDDAHGDVTRAVYERFYAVHPEAEEEFAGDHSIEHRMVSETLRMIVGLADGTMEPKDCEYWMMKHVVLDTELSTLLSFLDTLVATVRDGVGSGWTPAMDDAWRELVARWTPVIRNSWDALA